MLGVDVVGWILIMLRVHLKFIYYDFSLPVGGDSRSFPYAYVHTISEAFSRCSTGADCIGRMTSHTS